MSRRFNAAAPLAASGKVDTWNASFSSWRNRSYCHENVNSPPSLASMPTAVLPKQVFAGIHRGEAKDSGFAGLTRQRWMPQRFSLSWPLYCLNLSRLDREGHTGRHDWLPPTGDRRRSLEAGLIIPG